MVRAFAILVATLLIFSSVAFSAAAATETISFSQLLSKINDFISAVGSISISITGYQVSENTQCPAKIIAKSDKSKYAKGEAGTFTVYTYDSIGNPTSSKVPVKYSIGGTDYNGELITGSSGTFSTGITALGSGVTGIYSYTFSSPSGCDYVSTTMTYEIVESSTASSGSSGAGVAVSAVSSDTCTKYYTCPDGSQVKYCESKPTYDSTGNVIGSGCGCYSNPSSLCSATSTPAPSCIDSDGGMNYYYRGYVKTISGPYAADACVENNQYVAEYYCQNDQLSKSLYRCEYGCAEGACLKSQAPAATAVTQTTVPVTSGASQISEASCPARIEIVMAKDTYAVGDNIQMTVNTYNSNGALQGYDLTSEFSEQGTGKTSPGKASTQPSGIHEEKGVISSEFASTNGKVLSITLRSPDGCEGSGKSVSASKTITILPAQGTVPVPLMPPKEKVSVANAQYTVEIKKGWNLVSLLPFLAVSGKKGASASTCSWLQGDVSSGSSAEKYLKQNIFGYDSLKRKYVSLSELNSIPWQINGSYLVNSMYNSYWLRSNEDCSVSMDLSSAASNTEVFKNLHQISSNNYKLVQGWNFVAALPDMEGKTLDDFKGSCEIRSAYAFDTLANKWVNLNRIEFSHGAVGYGFVIKVAGDCVLGSESDSGLPPLLPVDNEETRTV